ncbi:MAG TPA: S-layer homology domain-containing protein [Acidimicrobiales bacterium]|nr:S-layer homology domain-containing protein [Acidimicrobiales bacterium]
MSFDQDLKTQIRTFVAIALAVAVGLVTANAASAGFDDVPSEGAFAESITRVQEAGIATGFADGTFRPRADISRQQSAAWLDRSMGRVGLDINGGLPVGPTLSSATPSAVVSTLEMTSPAAEGGSGWVTIQGGVGGVALAPEATCPCPLEVHVLDDEDNLVGRSRLVAWADPTGNAFAVAPVLAVTPIDGGETRTFRVVATLLDTSDEVLVGGALYASYAPLAEGDPAIEPESHRPDPMESMVPELP